MLLLLSPLVCACRCGYCTRLCTLQLCFLPVYVLVSTRLAEWTHAARTGSLEGPCLCVRAAAVKRGSDRGQNQCESCVWRMHAWYRMRLHLARIRAGCRCQWTLASWSSHACVAILPGASVWLYFRNFRPPGPASPRTTGSSPAHHVPVPRP